MGSSRRVHSPSSDFPDPFPFDASVGTVVGLAIDRLKGVELAAGVEPATARLQSGCSAS